jgi:hypothetical protein
VSVIRLCFFGCAATVLGLSACAVPLQEVPTRIPVRWIMVEKAIGEIVPNGQNGDGQVNPASMVLTLQPLYSEDVDWEVVVDPHDFFVEILEIEPSRQASPGETVSAKVRVGRAREGDTYRLTARASQSDVQIVGERIKTVRGSAPASFRFTSLSPGKGGIAIGVEKVEGRGP